MKATLKSEALLFVQDQNLSIFFSSSDTIHLSNLNYDICVRRSAGACAICWAAAVMGTAKLARGSFGLR